MVGYKFGPNNLATDLQLDSTPLLQGDVIGAYFLTEDDFIPPPAYPDQEVDFDLPSEGTIHDGGLLALEEPVTVGDVIEIEVENYFEIYRQGSNITAVSGLAANRCSTPTATGDNSIIATAISFKCRATTGIVSR